MTACPCNSQRPFDQCCGPFLAGETTAPTAEALMRSRYVAYVREDFPYLLRTWHASTRPPQEKLGPQPGLTWLGLEILRTEGGGPDDQEGVVEFAARFQANGREQLHREVSRFAREEGAWFYVDGEEPVQVPLRAVKIGRNEPCPCGSGKKFKKCCQDAAQG